MRKSFYFLLPIRTNHSYSFVNLENIWITRFIHVYIHFEIKVLLIYSKQLLPGISSTNNVFLQLIHIEPIDSIWWINGSGMLLSKTYCSQDSNLPTCLNYKVWCSKHRLIRLFTKKWKKSLISHRWCIIQGKIKSPKKGCV